MYEGRYEGAHCENIGRGRSLLLSTGAVKHLDARYEIHIVIMHRIYKKKLSLILLSSQENFRFLCYKVLLYTVLFLQKLLRIKCNFFRDIFTYS